MELSHVSDFFEIKKDLNTYRSFLCFLLESRRYRLLNFYMELERAKGEQKLLDENAPPLAFRQDGSLDISPAQQTEKSVSPAYLFAVLPSVPLCVAFCCVRLPSGSWRWLLSSRS